MTPSACSLPLVFKNGIFYLRASFLTRSSLCRHFSSYQGNSNEDLSKSTTSLFEDSMRNSETLFPSSLPFMEEITTSNSGSGYVSLSEAKHKFRLWKSALVKGDNTT